MRSLFFKIFVWFWTALIAVAATAVIAAFFFHKPRDSDSSSWRSVAAKALEPQARAAIEVVERAGEDALFNHLDHQDAAAGTHTFLLDASDRDLGGHRVPNELVELAHRARAESAVKVASDNKKDMVAMIGAGKTGTPYVFAREMLHNSRRFRGPPPRASFDGDGPDDDEGPGPGPGPGRPPPGLLEAILGDPGTLVAILAAVVANGGLVCYALARYLTRPVRLLRGATRKLAEGDLSARAGAPLTQRRDEIGELGREFDRMADQVQTLIGSHKRLLHDVSHELRSPLARLNVALELAAQGGEPSSRVHLDRVGREAHRLNVLIGELLTLARMDSGSGVIKRSRVQLGELLREVADDAAFEAASMNRRVKLEASDLDTVTGHENLLRSAFENVIRNAVRYTKIDTDVVIDAAMSTDSPSRAIIQVRDHGPGIPADQLADAFLPFHRIATLEGSPPEGVGLGLAIAKRAVEAEGGTIDATNAPGDGLIVTITLPCSQ